MIQGENIGIHGGKFTNTIINQINGTSKGMDILLKWVATGAFHSSDELYESPKCHPHTRLAVLDDIMKWVVESDSTRDDFMLWLFGPAGAGKSAIAKRIADIASEKDLLIGDFFFSRSSPTRNTKDRLVATIAYQLTVSIPDTRSYIEDAIERDPVIFNKNILIQIDTLLIKPLLSASTQTIPCQKLIIIDGLDECNDKHAQVAILEAISCSFPQHKLPVKFLVVSRPELSIVASFTSNDHIKSIHRRLALDDAYRPYDDIRLFFSDKFKHIRLTHPLKSTIPVSWPTQEVLRKLVEKSSGQFIYASTVVKFVESNCHRPTTRLNIILGISPPGTLNPFAELDRLYNHLLSSVDDIQSTLRVLSLYVMTPKLASDLSISMPPELFLSLEQGDIQLALINLSSILTYHESSGVVKVHHASLVDFLSDKHRSTTFYIDKSRTCIEFVRRILQYVKGPDGIRAGDMELFREVLDLSPWIPQGQLRSDILNFDLDGFINALIRWQYKKHPSQKPGCTIETFDIWMKFISDAGLQDGDKKEVLDRLKKSFELRLQTYQSDWRLQLLLALAVTKDTHIVYFDLHGIPPCRCLDILLEMDDHNLHLVDQNALDLRHTCYSMPGPMLIMISRYVNGDTYASAALHCMRFLCNPPKYSMRNERLEMGLTYGEWRETCYMTLQLLRILLPQANTSPELVQFINNHDIHLTVQKDFSDDHVLEVNKRILAFLSRAGASGNWNKICAIQQSLVINDRAPSEFEQDIMRPYEREDLETIQHLIQRRIDQCCLNADHDTF